MDFWEEVEDIPAGMITGWVNGKETGIEKIAPRGIVFRLRNQQDIHSVKVSFYEFSKDAYQWVELTQEYSVLRWEQEKFYWKVYIEILHKEYETLVKHSIKAYQDYIIEKSQSLENEFSKALVGYPCELDEVISPDFTTQKARWFASIDKVTFLKEAELALEIDTPNKYLRFLSLSFPEYLEKYWKEAGLVIEGEITRVYLGNAFCPKLFPELAILLRLLEKAKEQQLQVTLVTPFLKELQKEWWVHCMKRVIAAVREWKMHLEVEINDYGMLALLEQDKDLVTPILGVLLNKRRKDSRMRYKNQVEAYREWLGETGLHTREMKDFLEEQGIYRYEYEVGEIAPKIAKGQHSLHLPWYQTNTSSYCPLKAKVKTGDRGKQQDLSKCDFLCEDMVFLYPDHLKLVGKYNSLFGLSIDCLQRQEGLRQYLQQGVDRIVINL